MSKFCENPKCLYHVDSKESASVLEVVVPGTKPFRIERKKVLVTDTNLVFNLCNSCENVVSLLKQSTK